VAYGELISKNWGLVFFPNLIRGAWGEFGPPRVLEDAFGRGGFYQTREGL